MRDTQKAISMGRGSISYGFIYMGYFFEQNLIPTLRIGHMGYLFFSDIVLNIYLNVWYD